MTTRTVGIGIDPSGAASGGRVVSRSFKDIARHARTAKTGVGGTSSAMQQLGQRALQAAKFMAGFFAVRQMGRWTKAAIGSFAEFDAALNQSLAIMGDVSASMRADMAQAAMRVGEDLNFAASQGAEAFFFLASAGLDASQSMAALPQVAAFAKAGMFDFATATDLATDAQSALGLTVDDAQANLENMTRVTDVLVKGNILANATVQQFATALTSKAGSALKSYGKSVEEGVAVLAAYADQGVKAELAGNNLFRVITLLTSAARSNADAYDRLGVEVFDAQGEMNNMADILGDLETATAGMSDEARGAALEQLGFQARMQGSILPLIGVSDAVREYQAALMDAGGTTQQVAEKQMQTMSEQSGALRKRIQNLAITLVGEYAAGAVHAFTTANEWWDRNRVAVQVWAEVGLAAVASMARVVASFGSIAFDSLQMFVSMMESSAKFFTGDFAGALEAGRRGLDQFGESGESLRNIADATLDFGDVVNDIPDRIAELVEAQRRDVQVSKEQQQAMDDLAASMGDDGAAGAAAELTEAEMERAEASREVVANLRIQARQAQQLRDAQRQGNRAVQEAQDAITLENELRRVAADTTSEHRAEALQLVQALDQLRRETRDLAAAQEEESKRQQEFADMTQAVVQASIRARERWEQKARDMDRDAAKAAQEPYLEAARGIQRAFRDAFANVLTDGIDSFRQLATTVLDIITGMVADIAAAVTADKLGIDKLIADLAAGKSPGGALGNILKFGTGAAVGGSIGYGSGNPALGALSGAAAGAMTGGPIGAIIGGVGGLVGGLLGSAKKAEEARKLFKRNMDAWGDDLDAFARMFTDSTFMEDATQRITDQAEQLWDDLVAAHADKIKGAPDDLPDLAIIEKMLEQLRSSPLSKLLQPLIDFWEKAEEIAKTAAEVAADAFDKFVQDITRMREDISVRSLRARGHDDLADMLAMEFAQRRELEEAMAKGMDEGTLAMLRRVHELEREAAAADRAAEAAREKARADEKAAEQARERRAFGLDLTAREAALGGDDMAAARARLQADADMQLAQAQKLLDAGTITEDQFRRLADVIAGETTQALDRLAEAAEAAAAAQAEAAQRFSDDLRVRDLEAQGMTDEAAKLRKELAQSRELAEAQDQGFDADLLEELRRVQAREMERFLEELNRTDKTDAAADRAARESPAAAARAASAINEVVRRDVTGITTFQAAGMLDLMRLQLDVERRQLVALQRAVGRDGVITPRTPGGDRTSAAQAARSGGNGRQVVVHGPLVGQVTLRDGGPGEARRLAANLDAALGDMLGAPMNTRSSDLGD